MLGNDESIVLNIDASRSNQSTTSFYANLSLLW